MLQLSACIPRSSRSSASSRRDQDHVTPGCARDEADERISRLVHPAQLGGDNHHGPRSFPRSEKQVNRLTEHLIFLTGHAPRSRGSPRPNRARVCGRASHHRLDEPLAVARPVVLYVCMRMDRNKAQRMVPGFGAPFPLMLPRRPRSN